MIFKKFLAVPSDRNPIGITCHDAELAEVLRTEICPLSLKKAQDLKKIFYFLRDE